MSEDMGGFPMGRDLGGKAAQMGCALITQVFRGRSDLAVTLVQIERGVKLRLPGEQFFKLFLVVEGAIKLALIVGERFLPAQSRLTLLLGKPV